MKKALSLMEVLISVVLITFVIGALFDIKKSNLFFLDKFKQSSTNNEYLSMAITSSEKVEKRDTKIYLSDLHDFKDDDIRKDLKNIKVEIEDEEFDKKIMSLEDFTLVINTYETTYKIENKLTKKFYTIKLQ